MRKNDLNAYERVRCFQINEVTTMRKLSEKQKANIARQKREFFIAPKSDLDEATKAKLDRINDRSQIRRNYVKNNF